MEEVEAVEAGAVEAEAACDIQVRDSQADPALRARRRPVLPSSARGGADRPSVPASKRGPVVETDPVQDNCPVQETDPEEAIGLVLVDLAAEIDRVVKLAPAKDPPAATGAERSTIVTTITAAIMLATTTTGPTRAGETPAATGTGTERSIT